MKPRIAIVGIGGIFPGAPDLDGFWAAIRSGQSASADVPADRWWLDPEVAYRAGDPAPDRVYSRRACLLGDFRPDLDGLALDPEFLAGLDPVVHVALHGGRAALADASLDGVDPQRIGVIIGNIALPTDKSSELTREVLGPLLDAAARGGSPVFRPARTEPLNRHAAGLPAGVLARALGLGGGALALDAACASSLYAIKLAAEELLAGRADAMLTGGVSRPDCLYTQMGFSQLRALSPSGRCSPLDARADGLVVGEGGGFFVLKRVSDAIRAGDTIHAVIAGAGLSNDTGGNLLAPDVDGQLAAMRAAYAAAEWRPEDVDAIECHATGTAVGDRVEIESLHRLWEGRHRPGGKCVIGSVKSNVGHLLTGAGAAGVMKVLLALRHRVLPPTAHFERPAAGFDPATSPFEVLSDPRPWEERAGGAPRRAAVSAFGLGGINAHLLLEEWRPSPEPAHFAAPPRPPSVPVAVVGMAARYGPWEDLTAFRAHVFGGDDTRTRRRPRDFGLLASDAFRAAYPGIPAEGHFLDSLEIPLERFRIPPRELEETLPQQLLMLLAAADALRDAGAGDRLGPRAGVFVGLGLDPNAENFHLRWTLEREARTWDEARELDPEQNERRLAALRDASGPPLTANRTIGALAPIVASRIARRFRISGPSIALAGEETSGLRAIEAAVRALARDELDLVVAGAVDLTGDLRNLLGRGGKRGEQGDPRPDSDSPALRSEGAGAVVLKRLEDARRDGDRIYAVVTGIGVAGGGGVERSGPEAPAVTRAIRAALAEAGPEAARIGHVEAGGTGLGEDDGAEAEALVESYGGSRTDRGPALGSVAATMGHAGAATGLAAFLRACLCLHHQTLPPLVRGARLRAELREAGFRSEAHARPWLRNRVEGPRRAAVSGIGMDGTAVHMVLEEAGDAATERTPRLEAALTTSEALFAVRADSVSALQASLERLDRMAAESVGEPVRRLASRWRETEDAGRGGSRGLAIVARHAEELRGLIARARAAIDSNPDAALPGPDSPEPAGNDRIFHAPVPLAGPEAVAFLYPGAGNHYPGMGERLAVRFPQILARQDRENRRLLDQFAPARGAGPSPGAHLGRDRNEALLAQVAHGSLVTDLLDAVGVRPRAAIGYSLGESAALFALRAWPNRDEMQRRLERSPLFDRDLGGECRAARSAWNLGPDERVDWVSGVVDRGPDAVRDALAGRDRAYLQVINTPEECVVGGARAAVESLVRELRCLFVPLEGVSTVHCPVLEPVIEAYEALHRLDATPPEGIRFYSGASGRAYAVTRESAARAIRSQAAGTLDFPAVIEQAWADGARIFIEVGPGSSTSRMARRILEGRPHLARALAPTGGDEVSGFVRLLAALVAAGMRIDDALVLGAARPVPAAASAKGRTLAVDLGGRPFPPVELPPARTAATGEAPAPQPVPVEPCSPATAPRTASPASGGVAALIRARDAADRACALAHEAFLEFARESERLLAAAHDAEQAIRRAGPGTCPTRELPAMRPVDAPDGPAVANHLPASPAPRRVAFDREQCLEFATGAIARVLGPAFAAVDAHPTRVRLPAEPLMLVDRILTIEGEVGSLGSGRIVTEHDVLEDGWYLDGGCMPTGLAIEAGQADLFLSAYLGIDSVTRGRAVYRLLDAAVTFHRALPRPGEVIRYDIEIERFFRQGETRLFRFRFDASVNGEPLLGMRDGCAGFFTAAELAAGQGIVEAELARRTTARDPEDLPMRFVPPGRDALEREELDSLRRGALSAALGSAFSALETPPPLTIPAGRLAVLDRVVRLDPDGGRYGRGFIRAEQDARPDAWYLTCHFPDDEVMPGTLMYECSLQALRVFLLSLGWVAKAGEASWEPVPGVTARLKCRGQVNPSTRVAAYEVHVKELGHGPEPYALADTVMFADGRPIVHITDMNVRLTGADRDRLAARWSRLPAAPASAPLFDHDRILAFAEGKPSAAFGDRYRPFDEGRFIARLPAPPFNFLHRIRRVERGEAWRLAPGAVAVAEYDVPPDAWYFAADRQPRMPYAVLLEVALQSCGWLAAYLGSALTSDRDLRFRNLGGEAVQHGCVEAGAGTMVTTVTVENVSRSGDMILQHYDFRVEAEGRPVLTGNTDFGFFTSEALDGQVGIRDAAPYRPDAAEEGAGKSFAYPEAPPFPGRRMRMVDRIDLLLPRGGPRGLGFVRGSARVDPAAWFFRAHFRDDPVWPGSLGLEALLQLLKVCAAERWNVRPDTVFETSALGKTHRWVYRGQVVPRDTEVTVEAVVTRVDGESRLILADGYLMIDGRIIYRMNDFGLRLVAGLDGRT